jgi:hypothetical protein
MSPTAEESALLEMAKHVPAVRIALHPVPGQPVPNPAEVTSSVLGGWIHYYVSSYDPETYAVVFQQFFLQHAKNLG